MNQTWNNSKTIVGPLVIISLLLCTVFLGSMVVTRPLTVSTNQSGRLQTSAYTYSYELEWSRYLDMDIGGNDQIWDMAIDEHFNYYLAGNTTRGTIQGWFAKVNANGTQLWNKTWPTAAIYGIAENSSDHSVYLCGKFPSNVCLIKLNSTGSMMWNYTPPVPSATVLDVAISQSTNSIVLVGIYAIPNAFVIILAPNGTIIWGNLLLLGGLNRVAIDSNANIIHVANGDAPDGDEGMGVGKCYPNGTSMWYYPYGLYDGRYEGISDMAIDGNDNIYLVGYAGPIGPAFIFLMKIDPEGNHLWNRTLGPDCIADGIEAVGSDIYVIATKGFCWDLTLMLLKFNSEGQLLSNFTWERSPSKVNFEYGIPWRFCLVKDHQNNLYVAGGANQTTYDAYYTKFKATLIEIDGTDGIPGFPFNLTLIPLLLLLLYVALRQKLPSLAGKRRI